MSSTDQAMEVLKRLPKGPVTGAEIGVFAGKMSKRLLERGNLGLYMVDNWLALPRYGITQAQQDENKLKALKIAAMGGWVLGMDSVKAAECVEDESLDFVFIDADHSYEGVSRDVKAWLPKVRPGGLMGGHDYANPSEPCGMEVKRAVDEIAYLTGKRVDLGKDSTWFYR